MRVVNVDGDEDLVHGKGIEVLRPSADSLVVVASRGILELLHEE